MYPNTAIMIATYIAECQVLEWSRIPGHTSLPDRLTVRVAQVEMPMQGSGAGDHKGPPRAAPPPSPLRIEVGFLFLWNG